MWDERSPDETVTVEIDDGGIDRVGSLVSHRRPPVTHRRRP